MGRWDDKKSDLNKKIEDTLMKNDSRQRKFTPEFIRKWQMKFSLFVHKHGLEITLRQWILMLIVSHICYWIFIPAFLGDIGIGIINPITNSEMMLDTPVRIIVLLGTFFFYFAIDRGDGTPKKDPPPSDDSSDYTRNKDNQMPTVSMD